MRAAAVCAAVAFAIAARLGDADGEGGKLLFSTVRAAFTAFMLLAGGCRFQEFSNRAAFGAFVFE